MKIDFYRRVNESIENIKYCFDMAVSDFTMYFDLLFEICSPLCNIASDEYCVYRYSGNATAVGGINTITCGLKKFERMEFECLTSTLSRSI